jgi:hypothetical protein
LSFRVEKPLVWTHFAMPDLAISNLPTSYCSMAWLILLKSHCAERYETEKSTKKNAFNAEMAKKRIIYKLL